MLWNRARSRNHNFMQQNWKVMGIYQKSIRNSPPFSINEGSFLHFFDICPRGALFPRKSPYLRGLGADYFVYAQFNYVSFYINSLSHFSSNVYSTFTRLLLWQRKYTPRQNKQPNKYPERLSSKLSNVSVLFAQAALGALPICSI